MNQINMRWKCPHCGHAQIVTDATYNQVEVSIYNELSKHGLIGGRVTTIVCSNEDCKEISLGFALCNATNNAQFGRRLTGKPLYFWSLLPESSAKPQPGYIPEPIAKDYREACGVLDKSPNASATLSRRCLQGMIRDFCKIEKNTLKEQIDRLKETVDKGHAPRGVSHDTMDAIDAVRKFGNIGAHMAKDINLMIDVDSGEAKALIRLIEILFEEWYVARHERERKLKELGVMASEKKTVTEKSELPPPDDHQAAES